MVLHLNTFLCSMLITVCDSNTLLWFLVSFTGNMKIPDTASPYAVKVAH